MSRKILCLVIENANKDRQLIEKAGSYAKTRGVTDLLLLPSGEIVDCNLTQTAEEFPELGMPCQVLLKQQDSMRISYMDLSQAKERRPDLEFAPSVLEMKDGGFYLSFANDHIYQDAIDLAELDIRRVKLLVHLDHKLQLRTFRDYAILTLPYENPYREAILLDSWHRGVNVTWVGLGGEQPIEQRFLAK